MLLQAQIVVVFLVIATPASTLFGPGGKYLRRKSLLGDAYIMFWNTNATHLDLALQVKTTGWIGFGISVLGGMHGSDIVRVGGDDSDDGLEDGWAKAHQAPIKDCKQDWTLLSRSVADGSTIIELSRLLDTGDRQDHPIVDNGIQTRLIAAYGSSGNFGYHDIHREMFRVNFFDEEMDEVMTIKSDSTVQMFTIAAHGDNPSLPYTVGAIGNLNPVTTYKEFCAKVPPDVTKAHIIAMEPRINPKNRLYVHHFVVRGFSGTNCQRGSDEIWAWAPGGGPMVLPSNVGFPIGENEYKSFSIQTHYDNPTGKAFEDDSGVNIYYTTTLRQYAAGMLIIGDGSMDLIGLPVAVDDSENEVAQYGFTCPATWTKKRLPAGGITVFMEILHMHRVGHWMTFEVFDQDGNMKHQDRIDYYNGDLQDFYPSASYRIMPGDWMKTTCAWKPSLTAEFSGNFGLGTNDEMCQHFAMYYPRIDRVYCGMGRSNPYTIAMTKDSCLHREFGSCAGENSGSVASECPKPKAHNEGVDGSVMDMPDDCLVAIVNVSTVDISDLCPGIFEDGSILTDILAKACSIPSCRSHFLSLAPCEGVTMPNEGMLAQANRLMQYYRISKECPTETTTTTTIRDINVVSVAPSTPLFLSGVWTILLAIPIFL